MSANIRHRITSLERWGIRETRDFQPDAVATVGAAGFTGVLVNGGSGIGPDMLWADGHVEWMSSIQLFAGKPSSQNWYYLRVKP